MQLGSISADAYTLYVVAKDLYCGTKHITIRDLADKEIVSSQLFGMVCEAMTPASLRAGSMRCGNQSERLRMNFNRKEWNVG